MSGVPLVGYMVPFEVPSGVVLDHRGRRHRLVVDRGALDRFISLGLGRPLMLGHAPVFHSWGAQHAIGTVGDWRADDFGVLVRAELHGGTAPHPFGAAVPYDVTDAVVRAVRDGSLWGMSWGVAAYASDPPETPEPSVRTGRDGRATLELPLVRLLDAGVGEVTLTGRPAFPDARILGVGEEASWLWDFPDLGQVALAARAGG